MAVTKIDGAKQLKFSGNLDLDSNKIVNVSAPTSGSDAANKTYVDNIAQGLTDFKDSVRVASTASVDLASGLENGDTLDGITLATGDRVLLKDQTDASENGIYVVVASGAASRSSDADDAGEVSAGMYVLVEEGTANADTSWVLTTDGDVTIDTTDLTFTKFAQHNLGAASLAGAGLVTNGAAVDVASGNGGIVVNADDITLTLDGGTLEVGGSGLKIAAAGVSSTELATDSVATAKIIDDAVETDKIADNNVTLAKLADGTDGQFIINNGTTPTYTVMSGDATLAGDGALTISAGAVENDMLAGSIAAGKLTVTDGTLVVGNGSNVGALVSLSGDATMSNTGVVTLDTDFGIRKVVVVATDAAGTLSSSFANGETVDGVTLATNDRILVKDQADASENGIYIVNASGAPTRAADFDSTSEVASGSFVAVAHGTNNKGTLWSVASADTSIVVDTDDIDFARVGPDLTSLAGNGLAENGLAIDVNVDDSSIEIDSDSLRVKASGVTNAMLAGGIDPNKMTVADANIVVGNGSNLGVAVAMSGDVAIDNAGATTIQSSAVETGMIADNNVTLGKLEDGSSAELIVCDGSGNPTYVTVTGDVNIDNAGATVIQAGAVEQSMLAADAVGGAALDMRKETRTGSASTSWALSATPTDDDHLLVYKNGQLLGEGGGNDYTRSAGTLTFLVTPDTGDVMTAVYFVG